MKLILQKDDSLSTECQIVALSAELIRLYNKYIDTTAVTSNGESWTFSAQFILISHEAVEYRQ